MENFFYVYLLVSEADATQHYTGITRDLPSRLKESTIKAHAYTPPDAARGASKPQSHSDQKRRLELLKNI
jgi:hypothetical protein